MAKIFKKRCKNGYIDKPMSTWRDTPVHCLKIFSKVERPFTVYYNFEKLIF